MVTEQGLYRPEFERDSCGFGLIAQMDDQASHALVKSAITALERMTHRGAIAADGKTGDGCGLLMKKPEGFLRRVAAEADITLGNLPFCAGNLFLNPDEVKAQRAREVLSEACAAQGLTLQGWRVLPTDNSALGEEALRAIPRFEQVFITSPPAIVRGVIVTGHQVLDGQRRDAPSGVIQLRKPAFWRL